MAKQATELKEDNFKTKQLFLESSERSWALGSKMGHIIFVMTPQLRFCPHVYPLNHTICHFRPMLSRLKSGVGLSPLSTGIDSLRPMGPLSPEMGPILPDLGPLNL